MKLIHTELDGTARVITWKIAPDEEIVNENGTVEVIEHTSDEFDKVILTKMMKSNYIKIDAYAEGEVKFHDNITPEDAANWNSDDDDDALVLIFDKENEITDPKDYSECLIVTNVIYPLIQTEIYSFRAFSNYEKFIDLATHWFEKGFMDTTMLQTCVSKSYLTIDEYNSIVNK